MCPNIEERWLNAVAQVGQILRSFLESLGFDMLCEDSAKLINPGGVDAILKTILEQRFGTWLA
jgi:hypothetical protein